MLRLDNVNRKIQVVLLGAITTAQLPVMVMYSDRTSTAYSGAAQLANTNSTTAVDICAAPAASTVRDIDYISVRNSDTVAATVTIRYNDNATLYTIVTVTLAVGDQLVYVHGDGWRVVDASGYTKVTNIALTGGVTTVGNVATVVTNANLTGDVTSVGNATTLTNAPVIAKVLTGYVSGAGTIAATDSILTAVQKLNGNDAGKLPLAGGLLTGAVGISVGTVAAPGLYASGNTNTGLYFPVVNQIGFSCNGVNTVNFTTTGIDITGASEPYFKITNTAMAGSPNIRFSMNAGNSAGLLEMTAGTDFKVHNGQYALMISGSNGNVILGGTTNAGTGTLQVNGTVYATGLRLDYTNTATVGAVTINKASGRVNIAAAGTSVVVTNSLVTAASHIMVGVSQADATARVTSVVPAAGSFTINTAATTAQTSFDFVVFNAD